MREQLFYSFVLIVENFLNGGQKLHKCCEKEVVFNRGLYSCKDRGDNATSTQVIRTNLVYEKDDNNTQCIDIFEKTVSKFSKGDLTISKIEDLSVLTKCCPVEYFYNQTGRSCTKIANKNNTFTREILKIGLQCEIVIDMIINFRTDVIYNKTLTVFKTGETYLENQFCLDNTIDGRDIVRLCKSWRYCKKVKCVRKCCPDGQSFVNGSFCRDTFVHGVEFQKYKDFFGELKDDIGIIHGRPGAVYLEPNVSLFYLDEDGNFYSKKTESIYPRKEHPYCIEHATKNGINYGHKYFGFLVGRNPPMPSKFYWNRAAMIFSGICLMLTILFYVISRETKKIFGKILVCFCLSLLFLYSCLVYHTFHMNLHYKPTKTTCKVIGFFIIYLGFSCFFWLQVLCYDIYCKLGASDKPMINIDKRKRDCHKFFLYSLYGWGFPLVYIILLVVFHLTAVLPHEIEVSMGKTRCGIEKDNYADILFRSIPLTFVQIVNVILFVKTIVYVLQVKKEIQKMVETPSTLKKKRKFIKRKERFGLVVRLLITMGVFYLFEVVSSFFDFNDYDITSTIEIIWDFINCLQGLFIFLIFVCKRRNYVRFKKSSAVERIRKISLTASRKTSLTTLANVQTGLNMQTR
ncbi:G-protein coupled receptor Mth isoform X1 [Diabrotica virgifera virgifera]|uniref:G-protein coupled receptors family 2 profile 2 domain-containing protein n=1 Tax=Diabrotica virgifera virgifera TaxID=50390 RepID=A0ABM5IMI8_DIAVI|nr:G-protein coupled receptor Mth isoform X2 [Diabrotica virgifera virgifera]XP_050511844.1 G-protein coupled receptor Mth isoform X1 [Diabrotica virgifera virgifera]